MQYNKTIGNNLRELRKTKGWSQERAAEELDCSVDTIKRLEHGSSPLKADMIPVLCKTYETTIYSVLPAEFFEGARTILLSDIVRLIEKINR